MPPAAPQTRTVQIDENRAEFLEFLYRLYDRDNASLGLRGTYTGLYQQFQQELTDFLVETWHLGSEAILGDLDLGRRRTTESAG